MPEQKRKRAATVLKMQCRRPQTSAPPALVAILDREGMVLGVLAGRAAARSFLVEAAQ